MKPVLALMFSGFTEARRNRVTVVIAAFAATLILLTTVVLNTTVFTLDRAVTDFGLGVMSLLMVGLTVFLTAGMMSGEIERRTVFLVMSRPISRLQFVMGRFLGMVLTLTVLVLAMTVLYASQLVYFDVPTSTAVPAAIVGLWAELVVLASMGVFFSSFTSRIVASICLVGLYFLGHVTPDIYQLSQTAKSDAVRLAAKLLYRVVPNLDALDFRSEAAWASHVPLGDVAYALLTALGWTVVFLAGAGLTFGRRDFR